MQMTAEQAIANLRPDVQDFLTLSLVRLRTVLGAIFDVVHATPAITYTNLKTQVAAAYTAAHPAPQMVTIDTGLAIDALIARHGAGATPTEKYQSFRSRVLNFAGLKAAFVRASESAPDYTVAEMWLYRMLGNIPGEIDGVPVADLVYQETRSAAQDYTEGFVTEERWSSASLGKTVRRRYVLSILDGRAVRDPQPLEVV